MQSGIPIVVIIATSKERTELLLNRSLPSVYQQEEVNPTIIIVDDNHVPEGSKHSFEFSRIAEGIRELREQKLKPQYDLQYHPSQSSPPHFNDYFPTHVLKNTHTVGHSGTGAWNTAIQHLKEKKPTNDRYVAILDDDDEYLPDHLANCMRSVSSCPEHPAAVFSPLIWKDRAGETVLSIDQKRITQQEFFIGNPGVQGSNLFLRFDVLTGVNGFDENLYSATDRDLMIRILDHLGSDEKDQIIIREDPTVIHHADGGDRVTADMVQKKKGLDALYRKYRNRFSKEDFQQSLERAASLFGYEYTTGSIVIGMPLHNSAKTVKQALDSILNQRGIRRDLLVLIVNDGSSDDWEKSIQEYRDDSRILVVNVNLGRSYKVRNFILEYVRDNIPRADYIGRLDADDRLVDELTISKIEERMDLHDPDVIIAGNKLSMSEKILKRINYADCRLLNSPFLEKKLNQMWRGMPEGELPSCNVFVKPSVPIRYREMDSAEDHWYTVDLLLHEDRLNIHIAEDLLYAVYSLDGNATKMNRKNGAYALSRKMLHEFYVRNYGGEET